MKTKFKYKINYIAILLAIGSFCIGTMLLLLFKITQAEILMILGYFYIFLAAFINMLMLLSLVINAIIHFSDYKENLLTILGVLANIPITILYFDIVF